MYKSVRQYQHFNYKDKYSVTELEGTPDLEKLASAYDINFIKVTKNDQIDDAIDKFLKKDEAYLMEVDIDPMDLV